MNIYEELKKRYPNISTNEEEWNELILEAVDLFMVNEDDL